MSFEPERITRKKFAGQIGAEALGAVAAGLGGGRPKVGISGLLDDFRCQMGKDYLSTIREHFQDA